MEWLVVLVVCVLVVLVAAVVVVYWRRPRPVLPPAPTVRQEEDQSARRSRKQAADQLGSALIERRLQLDSRRGTLQGDAALDDAFDRLQERLQRGEISEEEFEAEKIRLLGG